MADNTKRLIDLEGLRQVVSKINDTFATSEELDVLDKKLEGIISEGGEPNTIDEIKVNGVTQSPDENKTVDITVPESVEDLEGIEDYAKTSDVTGMLEDYVKSDSLEDEVSDLGFVTDEEVGEMIAQTKHATFEIVKELPSSPQENVLYLYKNPEGTEKDVYDIYIYATDSESSQKKLIKIDDTSVDLSGYSTTEQVEEKLKAYIKETDLGTKLQALGYITSNEIDSTYAKKAELEKYIEIENFGTVAESNGYVTGDELDSRYSYNKETNKQLSQENFTTTLKSKLDSLDSNAKEVTVPTEGTGVIQIGGESKTVYTLPDNVLDSTDIANTSEVSEMLESIFSDD